MNKESFYPTPDEISYIFRNNSHKSFEELCELLGVDSEYLEKIMTEKNLKLSERGDE